MFPIFEQVHPTDAQFVTNPSSLQSWSNQGYPQPIVISKGSSDKGWKSMLPILLLLLADGGNEGGSGGPGCGGSCGYGGGHGGCGCNIPIPYPVPYPINYPQYKKDK